VGVRPTQKAGLRAGFLFSPCTCKCGGQKKPAESQRVFIEIG
jgi:hypothetical protein